MIQNWLPFATAGWPLNAWNLCRSGTDESAVVVGEGMNDTIKDKRSGSIGKEIYKKFKLK